MSKNRPNILIVRAIHLAAGVIKIIRPVNIISIGNLYIGFNITSSEVSLFDEELIVIS